MAVDVGYFRRWYGNFIVTDNPLTTAADYDRFSVVVPTDPRLPLSGQTISGVTNIHPSKASLVTTNRDRFAPNYGKQYEFWHMRRLPGTQASQLLGQSLSCPATQ